MNEEAVETKARVKRNYVCIKKVISALKKITRHTREMKTCKREMKTHIQENSVRKEVINIYFKEMPGYNMEIFPCKKENYLYIDAMLEHTDEMSNYTEEMNPYT